MPYAPKRRCSRAGCPHWCPCPVHPPQPWARRVHVSQGRRDVTPALRAQVLEEEPVCRLCATAPSVQVDHLVPLRRGGGSERANLAGVCARCHARKTGREVRAWRGGMKS